MVSEIVIVIVNSIRNSIVSVIVIVRARVNKPYLEVERHHWGPHPLPS